MNIEFTSEQLKYQESFRAFVQSEIIPYAGEYDRNEYLPTELIEKVSQSGYLGATISKKYDGLGYDMITLGLLNEEVGRGCSSTRALLTVHGMVALAIEKWGTDEQKEYWLPKMAKGEIIGAFGLTEPQIGSDAKSIETSAALINGNYILNGSKKWITMGQIADIFIIFAKLDGKPTAFLVEKNSPGFSAKEIHGMMGVRASMVAELCMDDCHIPETNMIGRPGTGLSHVAFSCLDYGRYTIAWGCVGIGQACIEESVRYAKKRKQFGCTLSQNQLIQKMITEMVVNVKAARLMCLNAGYLKDTGDPETIMETWNAKYFASTMLNKVAGDAVQIHGANGLSQEYSVERYYRDAKINEIIEGTTQMHEILIAKNIIGNN
ncbi:acyl-CoA dehydrogenase [Lysinibacillus sphaericus]|uniref:Acyl-CoA dehydrogenase n=2 Tax=Lysinibacillus sphaericus TaxID=1421 RepID=A0A544UCW1_LYSSH|nr:acyl-CoA dehydrogenase [Lysinibacillus sp. SDF0037]